MTGITTIAAPQNIDDLGIRQSFIEDLALKHIYLGGELMVDKLAAQLRLGFKMVNNIYDSLRRAELCEVKGAKGRRYFYSEFSRPTAIVIAHQFACIHKAAMAEHGA